MRRPLVLRAGLALCAALVATAAGVAITEESAAHEATVVGYFTDASPLDPGSQVRAAGVNVGDVEEIVLDDGKARVTLNVNPSVLPLHKDATLRLRPVNLLGEQYVELDAGTPSQPFMKEPVVPAQQTGSSTDLQEVINTFDNPTSTALATLVTSLGEGLDNSGGEAAAAVKALAPAMRRAADLGAVLRHQNDQLNELVDSVEPVAKSLAAKDGKSLDRLVGSTERTLSTLSANQRALNATMGEMPATLMEARRTLRELAGVSEAATPTLRAVRPVTGDLDAIASELNRFADAADPAFVSLRPVLVRADELLKQAAPAVAQLRKAGPDLRATTKNLRPLGDEVLNDNLGDLMAFVKKWSLSTNSRDALGHYFRGVVHVTPTTLRDLASTALPTQQSNSDGSTGPVDLGKLRPDLSKPLPDSLFGQSGNSDPGNATGLTPKQEQSMLGQLLGGS